MNELTKAALEAVKKDEKRQNMVFTPRHAYERKHEDLDVTTQEFYDQDNDPQYIKWLEAHYE